jgi:hypothetical protein
MRPRRLMGASVRPLNFTVRGRVRSDTQCHYRPIVARLAFWGPRRPAQWKRPVLFGCSLAGALGIGWILWTFRGRWAVWGRDDLVFTLGVALLLLSILGLVVSIRACDACVARLCGDL